MQSKTVKLVIHRLFSSIYIVWLGGDCIRLIRLGFPCLPYALFLNLQYIPLRESMPLQVYFVPAVLMKQFERPLRNMLIL